MALSFSYTLTDGTTAYGSQVQANFNNISTLLNTTLLDGTYIQNGALTNSHISASAAIAYSKLNLAGSITSADLAGSIAASKLATTTPGYVLLGLTTTGVPTFTALSGDITVTGGGVTAIGSGKVLTAMIADANVTAAKIASDAVTTAKILDANVTAAKVADNAITSRKVSLTSDLITKTGGTTSLSGANTEYDIITMSSSVTPDVNCTAYVEAAVLYSAPSSQANIRIRIYESSNGGSSYSLVSDETSDALFTAPNGNYAQGHIAVKRSLTAATAYRWKVVAQSVTGVGNVTQNSATYLKYEILK